MKEAYKLLLNDFKQELSFSGCNDFTVENTKENYKALELSAMRNLGFKTLEELRNHPDYDDYKPCISIDGKTILTYDYIILECLKHDLELD